MQPQLATLSQEDQKKIKDFILTVWQEFNYVYRPQFDSDLDDPHAFYVGNGGTFYVLRHGDDVIGTIGILKKDDDTAEFKRFYIHPKHRGKKYGSLVLDTAIEYCVKNNIKKIEFETDKIFTKAHQLYKKRGFQVFGEDEDVYYFEKYLS